MEGVESKTVTEKEVPSGRERTQFSFRARRKREIIGDDQSRGTPGTMNLGTSSIDERHPRPTRVCPDLRSTMSRERACVPKSVLEGRAGIMIHAIAPFRFTLFVSSLFFFSFLSSPLLLILPLLLSSTSNLIDPLLLCAFSFTSVSIFSFSRSSVRSSSCACAAWRRARSRGPNMASRRRASRFECRLSVEVLSDDEGDLYAREVNSDVRWSRGVAGAFRTP